MLSAALETVCLRLFRAFPPRTSDVIFKETARRADSEYAAEGTWPFFRYFRSTSGLFEDQDVLDVGSGFGGRTVRYLEYGASSVTGLEVEDAKVAAGRSFARQLGATPKARFELGFGERLPFEDAKFGLVTLLDTLEHVVAPDLVLLECYRVLRLGGRLAVVFPPYYSFTSGSHLHGYATRLPGLNLLFPTSVLRSAVHRRLIEQRVDYATFLRDIPTDKLPNQNGLTIGTFRRLVERTEFQVEYLENRAYLEFDTPDRRRQAKPARRVVFAAARLLARAPLLEEVACSRVCALLRRPAGGD